MYIDTLPKPIILILAAVSPLSFFLYILYMYTLIYKSLLLAGVSSLPFDHCLSIYTSLIYTLYPPPTDSFASRWGFTIVILPLPFVYIPFHIHPHTLSYTPSTFHRPIILLLAGVSTLPFNQGHLYIDTFIYTHTFIFPSTAPLTPGGSLGGPLGGQWASGGGFAS